MQSLQEKVVNVKSCFQQRLKCLILFSISDSYLQSRAHNMLTYFPTAGLKMAQTWTIKFDYLTWGKTNHILRIVVVTSFNHIQNMIYCVNILLITYNTHSCVFFQERFGSNKVHCQRVVQYLCPL